MKAHITSWDDAARIEGDEVSPISLADSDDIVGGWGSFFFRIFRLLLRPTLLHAPSWDDNNNTRP